MNGEHVGWRYKYVLDGEEIIAIDPMLNRPLSPAITHAGTIPLYDIEPVFLAAPRFDEVDDVTSAVFDWESWAKHLNEENKRLREQRDAAATELAAANGKVERMREALIPAYEKLKIMCGGLRKYEGGVPTQVLFPKIEAALSDSGTIT